MTRKARRILFYGLCLIFLLIGTSVVFYSMGWRVDFTNLTIKQTGGIFIKSNPREINIQIDGKPTEQRRWLLVSGTLIKGLLPKDYRITITKDGFRDWNSEVPVLQEIVSDLGEIILLPIEIKSETIASSTKDFWITDGRIVTLGETLLHKEVSLPGSSFVGFMGREEKIVTFNDRQKTYLLYDGRERSTLNLSLLFNNLRKRSATISDQSLITKVITRNNNSEELFIATEEALYALHVPKLELTLVDENPWDIIEPAGSSSILTANKEKLALFDLVTKGKVWQKNIINEDIQTIKSNELRNSALVTADGDLFYTTGAETKKIAEGVENFALSNREKIAFIDRDGALKIYHLGKDTVQTASIQDPHKVKEIEFLNDNHLLAAYDTALYVIELAPDNLTLKQPIFYFEKIAGAKLISVWHFEPVSREIYFLNGNGDLNLINYFKNIF